MLYLKKKQKDFSCTEISVIVQKLKQGKVLILPTDTIYGLSCLSLNKKALDRVSVIKNRPDSKPFINLVSSLSMARKYAQINSQTAKLLKKIWLTGDRPTTIILEALKKLPRRMISEDGAISLRLPKSDFLIKIVRKVGAPLISTSLNLSGEKPLKNLKKIKQVFVGLNQPDLVVDVGALTRLRPSRIIDLRFEPPKIIRK